MIIVRFHYTHQSGDGMKCTELFLSRKDFEAWHERYHDKIKNVRIQGA